ncbi:hypothetical protein GCM10012275_58480 [Longimycelium tulufanense]|uniref:Uncharacterized protein n=1 Tax=Longimycelium tulufanense TaxID=907463 RepID=A0A8J3FZG6_9PSEU|nr:hypothetical protein [Longimycelium tulufanense]GGM80211.1 hypothetical protein GCM10012275_58480 [Longimycelium tulufanense]
MSRLRKNSLAMDEDLELLLTAVVAAENDLMARAACRDLQARVAGRVVETADCSDEDPGCWSVTISCLPGDRAAPDDAAGLSRAVRDFLRRLGPEFTAARVSCEPPTAWTVLDDPDLVGRLVRRGERLLVEAWTGAGWLPVTGDVRPGDEDPDELDSSVWTEPPDDGGGPRLRLWVEVVAEREAGAEWQARAVAGRVARSARLLESVRRDTVIRVGFDLGPVRGDTAQVLNDAMIALGGNGWTFPQQLERAMVARWMSSALPRSGIAAIELSADFITPAPR